MIQKKYSKILISFISFWLICPLLSCSTAPTKFAKYSTKTHSAKKYHRVKKGQTLYYISKKYNISVKKLMIYNHLSSYTIEIGQKIYLQQVNKESIKYITPKKIPDKGYHLVKKGQTLYAISKIYDVDYLDLIEYNDLNTTLIYPNQRIYLKERKKTTSKIITPKEEKATKDVIKQHQNLKLIWPANGTITSHFGKRGIDFHKGIDIAGENKSKIFAVEKGRVVFSGQQKGYGNLIVIEHSNYVMTVYSHNYQNMVNLGQTVKKGQLIALMGQTGRATGVHLHFEYRIKGKAIDPLSVLPKK